MAAGVTDRIPVPALAVAIAVILLGGVAVSVARGGDGGESSAPTTTVTAAPADPASPTPPLPRISIIAQAIVPNVGVFNAPGSPQPVQVLTNPQPSGAPLVFLVRAQQGEWLNVVLPTPPPGSTGWVRSAEVSLAQHDYEVVIELGARRIRVFKSGQVLQEGPIAVGVANAPPPGSAYFLKELLQLPAPDTVYGAYAFGLSGFTNQVTNLERGEGVTGLHGTNDPARLGKSVRGGSIAVSNETITVLAVTVPLGVPVDVRP